MSLHHLLDSDTKEQPWSHLYCNALDAKTLNIDTLTVTDLEVKNDATIDHNLEVKNDTTIDHDLEVKNDTTIDHDLDVKHDVILGTDVSNEVKINGQLTVEGNITANGSILNTAGNGIQFKNTTGATSTPLEYYEEYSDTAFDMIGPFTTEPQPITIKIIRIGKNVSITIPPFSFVASSAAPITSSIGVPARFRHSTNPIGVVVPVISGGVIQVGNLQINSSGVITVYSDIDNANFASSGSDGVQVGTTVIYNIN